MVNGYDELEEPFNPTTPSIRAIVIELASIPRLPTSAGERRAAHLIRRRLQSLGCQAAVEEVPAFYSYARPIGLLNALAITLALASHRGHRAVGTAGGILAALGIVDDITGRWMLTRKLLMRRRTTTNVIAEIGDQNSPRTLCVLAHHDAAPSGWVFRLGIEEWLATHRPDIVARMTSNLPMWWLVIGGPSLIALGSASRSKWLYNAGLAISLGSLAAMLDIGRKPAVPGANDNLSGVAALLSLAATFQLEPLPGLRVILVSAGAEEALQEGIRAFARGHFGALPPKDTFFINLDTIGSGRLVLLEAEGPVRLHYYDAPFKNLVERSAVMAGIPLIRGLRSRNSTDGSIPSKHGYATVTIVSVDHRKLVPNYHQYTDVPENLEYDSIESAIRLVQSVARALAKAT